MRGGGRVFFHAWPVDYNRKIRLIAYVYHWPPDVLDSLDFDDLDFWYDAAKHATKGEF